MIKIGDVVEYVDSQGIPHSSLVLIVWKNEFNRDKNEISLNLAYVPRDNENAVPSEDSYGRKIVYETSVVHKDKQSAPGNYWEEKE